MGQAEDRRHQIPTSRDHTTYCCDRTMTADFHSPAANTRSNWTEQPAPYDTVKYKTVQLSMNNTVWCRTFSKCTSDTITASTTSIVVHSKGGWGLAIKSGCADSEIVLLVLVACRHQLAPPGAKRGATSMRWKPFPAGITSHAADRLIHEVPPNNYNQSVCSHVAGCRLNSGGHLIVKVR